MSHQATLPVDDASEPFVVGVVVAPDDLPADHAALLLVDGVVGAVEREVAQGGELGPRCGFNHDLGEREHVQLVAVDEKRAERRTLCALPGRAFVAAPGPAGVARPGPAGVRRLAVSQRAAATVVPGAVPGHPS
jgi:hypothetical protein